ncbi:guanitoxin biosynthesis heme-dependent pre-guanitoxin N-hydroxylase GntA [Phycicoccus sonneratiae]|uniref:YqcI/YcgG family protein n=1 Tax=Phycicoccus sonneratiae TaxID=2807628 RepID=A0ABS2CQ62_9MICO|nr:guanitoxin biosynthesis heme-dependent pre-guanitoxin N-hydroxylase GntA [Phycicoccus sonneraticus]MBM6402032.1 YqcI/YcgG family protein [Phycicoccus sonneraticus]
MPPPHEPAARPLEDLLSDRRADHLDTAPDSTVVAALAGMVAHPDYPCLGARSVFRREAVTAVVLDDLTDTSPGGALDTLGERLRAFARTADPAGDLVSFVACFRGPEPSGEQAFEADLWAALRHLHEHDAAPWAGAVAADPVDPHFAFSVGGTPFFVVGLHPDASRIARRAPVPTLVFNLHEQFERLRADGRYARMRDTIRRRDTDLQGSLNPMVADHGDASEALQYSGREVPPGWTPPFHPRPLDEEPA